MEHSFNILYKGYSTRVDIYPVTSREGEVSFDLTFELPEEIPEGEAEVLLSYLHREGFFDFLRLAQACPKN